MSDKFTSGPWAVDAGMVFSTQGDERRICTPCSVEYSDNSISGYQDMYEAAANAKLISCAPELLQCLRDIIDEYDDRVSSLFEHAEAVGCCVGDDVQKMKEKADRARMIIKKASWL